MQFVDLQTTVYDAIAGHPTFKPNADGTVFEDFGNIKSQVEAALDVSNGGAGYAIEIWPPARGHSDSEMAGISGVDCLIVVRFEINPKMLQSIPQTNLRGVNDEFITGVGGEQIGDAAFTDVGEWVNTRVKDIISAVLSLPPELNMERFQLAADAFELTNFDEGLLAYHIRFARFAVFGQGI